MKKALAALFLTAVTAAVTVSCRNNDTPAAPTYSMVGRWQPVQKVQTVTTTANQSSSETYQLSDCEKTSVYDFRTPSTGVITMNQQVGLQCVNTATKTINYTYESGTGTYRMDSEYGHEEGKVAFTDANTMNLSLQTQNAQTGSLTVVTYTLKRL